MNTEVLVLNQDYEPLNVCAMPRAFRLVIGGKAEILAEGMPIRSASRSWTAPSVVRLRHRVRRPRPRAKLSRKEIFARDGHACQYCGRTAGQLRPRESLTRDHVVPLSRGGTNAWTNVVTACSGCSPGGWLFRPRQRISRIEARDYGQNLTSDGWFIISRI